MKRWLLFAAALAALAGGGCGGDDSKDDGGTAAKTTHTTAVDPAVQARLMARGKRIFAKNCHLCHELAGKPPGGPPIEQLAPNLDEVKVPVSYVHRRVTSGGYDMGAFSFRGEQLRAIVTYVATTAGRNVEADAASDVSAGEQIFRTHCERCHTIAGRPMTGSPDYPGTDFNVVKPSTRFVVRVLHDSLAESMPVFAKRLSAQQLRDVAEYVHAVAGEKGDGS